MGRMARTSRRSVGVATFFVTGVFVGMSLLSRFGEAGPIVAPHAGAASIEPSAGPSSAAPTPGPSLPVGAPVRRSPDLIGPLRVDPPTAIRRGSAGRSSLAMTARYEAVVDLGVRSGALHVSVTIEARNDDPEPVDRIELNTVAPRLAAMILERVTVDGVGVAAIVDDQTIVVPLGGLLPPGESVRLRLSYSATIGDRLAGHRWLFSRAGGVVALYRWLPWVSRATPFDRDNFGDPFVTPVSPSVQVRLQTDRPVVVAATGSRLAGDDRDGTYAATDVRDFTLIIAEDYRIATVTVDGIEVRVMTRPGGLPAATLLELVRRALPAMAARLGPYPYPSLTVAESAGGFGMESPALVWIPRTGSRSSLDYVVPHEIGHQWFYALVGNDQAREPFADEAVVDMLTRDVMDLRRAPRCRTASVDGSIYEYGRTCYFETVYVRGGRMLDEIRRALGSDVFWAAMRGYIEAHRFGLGSTGELIDALDAVTPRDIRADYAPLLPSLP